MRIVYCGPIDSETKLGRNKFVVPFESTDDLVRIKQKLSKAFRLHNLKKEVKLDNYISNGPPYGYRGYFAFSWED